MAKQCEIQGDAGGRFKSRKPLPRFPRGEGRSTRILAHFPSPRCGRRRFGADLARWTGEFSKRTQRNRALLQTSACARTHNGLHRAYPSPLTGTVQEGASPGRSGLNNDSFVATELPLRDYHHHRRQHWQHRCNHRRHYHRRRRRHRRRLRHYHRCHSAAAISNG